jgi:hypothetical protein
MFGITKGVLAYWAAQAAVTVLVGRLVLLQYGELSKEAARWYNWLVTALTTISFGLLGARHLGRYLFDLGLGILKHTVAFSDIAPEDMAIRELTCWCLLGVVGLVGVFKWLRPSLAPTPGTENAKDTPNTTVIVHPSPAINLAGLDSVGEAIGKILRPLINSTENGPVAKDSGFAEAVASLQEALKDILTHIQAVAIAIESMPRVNILSSSLLAVADLVHEEGAAIRQTVREVAENNRETDKEYPGFEIAHANTAEEDGFASTAPLVAGARIQKTKETRSPKRVMRRENDTRERPTPVPQHEVLLDELKQKPPTIMTKEDFEDLVGKTQQEAVMELQRREKEDRNRDRLPEGLTKNEKEMACKSLAMLDRQWRMKAGWKIKPTDHIEIGQLTEEQLQLPRNLVLQIIRNRRAADFTERMRIEGREVVRCEKCRRLYPIDSIHNCFVATGFSRPARRDGVPATKEMLITQTGRGGIQIRQQVGVNADKLNENYKRMTEYKMVVADREKSQGETLQNSLLDGVPSHGDASMGDSQTGEDPAVVLATNVEDYSDTRIRDKTTGQVFRLVPC